MILTLLFFFGDAVFRFLRYRHYTVDIMYLWAEVVRDNPQSIAEFWLFISIFASCEEAAQLGNVAQRGGLRTQTLATPLTTTNTILIGVSIGVYGVMTVAGIYETTIALSFNIADDAKYHSGIHKYRRYWTVLIVAFLACSMLGLAFVMVFDWFNMEPYDLFSMIYAIVYAATTAVMLFCIASLIKIQNPMADEEPS
ncbi:uncharacterized protein Z519_01090 [Cladophialophora bantiana CBS 173.52]|uniref:Amino acid permease/ SLC12A domain-containing protein n=1 Tax=Cladophialophora bantiana (strain ATCC 10958 / CBS 173.52 / CDC B-1940 / NIH 8579) TaxID=1442370 RepID=A0A0D2F5Q2_CLAB1|nr:uncharacterized protein Z519_01090 [Cladophialophora bantiana CBS 173.52]KIW97506.1 hypothetical protein Z519_01090 [Cladophialophora bantiana CBS 173.52]